MKGRIIEHIAGILFVTALLFAILLLLRHTAARTEAEEAGGIRELATLEFVDYENPFHRALLREVLEVYAPGQHATNARIIRDIDAYRDRELANRLQRAHLAKKLSAPVIGELLVMYLKFILVYAVVMALTYYGVQTLAVWRFVRQRRRAEAGGVAQRGFIPRLRSLGFEAIRTIGYFILFSPAYVIAYSLRTRLNTDTLPFMIVLAVISNGLLVTYTHRFYTFLVAEGRRGYVETARVKNLAESYRPGKHGIGWRQIVALKKRFAGHVFGHIYSNARSQYLSTIKEQASFLITGLIIIEMALNIHGYLNYEMLRQMLYRNWEIVVCIVLGIFLLVKATDITMEILVSREAAKYENA